MFSTKVWFVKNSSRIVKYESRVFKSNPALTDEQVNAMDWITKVNYLKRNPVIVARQIDYVFKQLWVKVILSRMHPIGQILNFDDQREFHNRETRYACPNSCSRCSKN